MYTWIRTEIGVRVYACLQKNGAHSLVYRINHSDGGTRIRRRETDTEDPGKERAGDFRGVATWNQWSARKDERKTKEHEAKEEAMKKNNGDACQPPVVRMQLLWAIGP